MKVKSLSHIGLTVSDFEAAVRWYHDKFGCRLIDENILPPAQVTALKNLYGVEDTSIKLGFLRAPGGGVVEIFEFEEKLKMEKVRWNRPGLTHMTFDVKNVERWYKKLKGDGVQFFSEPQTTKGADWVFLKDPDGNLIELIDMKMNNTIIKSFVGAFVALIFGRSKYKAYYN